MLSNPSLEQLRFLFHPSLLQGDQGTINLASFLWDNNFFQSLKTEYKGKAIDARASELKEEVRMIFNNVVEPLDQLELIDQLWRAGLDYHYHNEINCTLNIS